MEITVTVSPSPSPKLLLVQGCPNLVVGNKLESIKSWKSPVSIAEFAGEAQMAYSRKHLKRQWRSCCHIGFNVYSVPIKTRTAPKHNQATFTTTESFFRGRVLEIEN